MLISLFSLASFPTPALRDLAGVNRGETAAGLSEGGIAWLHDLTVPDPTFTLPLLLGATTFLNVEVSQAVKTPTPPLLLLLCLLEEETLLAITSPLRAHHPTV